MHPVRCTVLQHLIEGRLLKAALLNPKIFHRLSATRVADWLETAVSNAGNTAKPGLFSHVIQQADRLLPLQQQQQYSTDVHGLPFAVDGSAAERATSPHKHLDASTSARSGFAHSTCAHGISLQEQHIMFDGDLTAPQQTSVPVHKLVAVFSSLLSCPTFPRGTHMTTMDRKWRLLLLLLLHAAGDVQSFESNLQQLLSLAMRGGQRKLALVQANPKIPEANKQLAEQQYERLLSTCQSIICDWVHEACGSPAFQALQPAMQQLAPAMTASVLTAAETLVQLRSLEAGRLMEVAAEEAVRAALPEGWTLLTNLHLLGVDGHAFSANEQRGFKFEADMLVLDQDGVAVAFVEVKLAAANPLMSLVNDVTSFLRLVDAAAGRSLTCLTKDEATVVAAAAAAAASRVPEGTTPPQLQLHQDLKSTIATMTHRPPFAAKPMWQVLHVPVHKELTPVYILGNSISEEAITRGISTFMSGSALRMLAKSADTLAAGLAVHTQQQQKQQSTQVLTPVSQDGYISKAHGSTPSSLKFWHRPTNSLEWTSSSSCDSREAVSVACSSDLSSCASTDSCLATPLKAPQQQPASAVNASHQQQQQQQQHSTTCSPSDLELHQITAHAESLNAVRARIRSPLLLDTVQQHKLSEQVKEKLSTLRERCKVFALLRQS